VWPQKHTMDASKPPDPCVETSAIVNMWIGTSGQHPSPGDSLLDWWWRSGVLGTVDETWDSRG
jgi:hypothetical protein